MQLLSVRSCRSAVVFKTCKSARLELYGGKLLLGCRPRPPHLMNESLLRSEAAMRGSLKETRGCQSAKRRFVAAGTRSDAQPPLVCLYAHRLERKTTSVPLFFFFFSMLANLRSRDTQKCGKSRLESAVL